MLGGGGGGNNIFSAVRFKHGTFKSECQWTTNHGMDISMADLCNRDLEILWWSPIILLSVYIWKCSGKLERGHHRLKPCDSSSVLLDGSGPSYDFVAKISGVDTPLFLFNKELYFPLSSLLVHKSHRSRHTYIVSDSSVGSVFAYCVGGLGSIPSEVTFLITMSIMALEAIKFDLYFKSLH
jgi:hypothetical protein